MGEAPDPTEPATTQFLPDRTVAGHELAWWARVARYRPRILRWCRRLLEEQGQAQPVPSVGNGAPP